MARPLDLAGDRFGKLVAVSIAFCRNAVYWHCDCDCGKQTIVRAALLKNNHVASCGCGSIEQARINCQKWWKRNERIPIEYRRSLKDCYQNMLKRCTDPSNNRWDCHIVSRSRRRHWWHRRRNFSCRWRRRRRIKFRRQPHQYQSRQRWVRVVQFYNWFVCRSWRWWWRWRWFSDRRHCVRRWRRWLGDWCCHERHRQHRRRRRRRVQYQSGRQRWIRSGIRSLR